MLSNPQPYTHLRSTLTYQHKARHNAAPDSLLETVNSQGLLGEIRKSVASNTMRNKELNKNIARLSNIRSHSSHPALRSASKPKISILDTERTHDKFYKHEIDRVVFPGDFEDNRRKAKDYEIRRMLSPIASNREAVRELCKTLFRKEYDELIEKGDNEVEEEKVISLIYKNTPRSIKILPRSKSTHQTRKMFTWKLKPTIGFKPETRDSATFTFINNRFYLFGGMSRVLHNDVRVLNPTNSKWTQLKSPYSPQPRMGHFACQYKDKLLIYGGCSIGSSTSGTRACFPEVWYMNTRNGVWISVYGSGSVPVARRNMCAGNVGRSLVIYGGITDKNVMLDDLYVFDMKHRTWSKMACNGVGPGKISNATFTAVFENREDDYKMSVFEIGGRREWNGFYVFGGKRENGDYTNEMYIMKVVGNAFVWQKIEAVGIPPAPRYNHTAVCINDHIFIYGGRNDSTFKTKGDSCLGDMSYFNISTIAWKQYKVLGYNPEGRWGHCMVTFNSKILILGGLSHRGFLASEIYELETDQTSIREMVNPVN